MRRAFAPGRVNLIGEHTDHTGGWVLPMAVQLGTTVSVEPSGPLVRLASDAFAAPAVVPLAVADPATFEPAWARFVAGVVAEVGPTRGAAGSVASTLPVGAGLSSSSSFTVAVALALGADADPRTLARLARRAEQAATGVPCGVMDQLAITNGVPGHALLIECRSETIKPVAIPDDLAVVAVHSGHARTLAGSEYADRRAACEAAVREIGPLSDADPTDLSSLTDPVVRARARHVIGENRRVLDFVEALRRRDTAALGELLAESHRSLRDDFAVSTPALDALVERLAATPGVHGARLTGAGFGGCAVALCEPGALTEGWPLVASGPARVAPDWQR